MTDQQPVTVIIQSDSWAILKGCVAMLAAYLLGRYDERRKAKP